MKRALWTTRSNNLYCPRFWRGLFSYMPDTSLQHFIEQLSGEDHSRVQDDLGNGFVRLKAAEAQRRQAKQDIRSSEDVVIELLRNARDAHAKAIFIATWATKEQRFLTMLDDGDGVPFELQETIFEPFVTSKLDSFHADRWGVHGRGMALYSIRQNADKAQVVASAPGLGSVFSVTTSFLRLGEKRDQSSAPCITKGEDGKPVLRGPHNILRTVLEFAIEERGSVAVYLGSAAEIVSTLYWLGRSAASTVAVLPSVVTDEVPFIQRFALCEDASSLSDLSYRLGLPMSSRTAYRIMKGEVKPLPTHMQAMLGKADDDIANEVVNGHGNLRKERSVRIAKEDLDTFSESLKPCFSSLAQAYYLDSDVEVSARCSRDELVVRIPLRRID